MQTRGKIGIAPKLWTRKEFRLLVESGHLNGNRFELLEGAFWDRPMQGEKHLFVFTRIQALLIAVFGLDFVRPMGTMAASDHDQPEPDLAVTKQQLQEYMAEDDAPDASEFLLAVEVSDSTLSKDRKLKAGIYARAGLPEYWILNVNARQLIVHRTPARGKYQSVVTLNETESVAPLAAPEKSFAIAEMLPPRPAV